MSLVWLYAVRLGGADRPPAGPGVDGERPRFVAEGPLVAVVGTVREEEFDEAALARAMEDLGRIERLARAHHAVIVETAAEEPTAPLRLATLYRDDEAVARTLRERADEFGRVLERVRDRQEWGVKVYVDAKPEAAAEEPASSGKPGTAYLLRRRADRDRGAQARERARAVADRIDETLARVAAAAHRMKPQDARLSGRAQEMVLNATYLVDAAAEEDFRAALAAVEAEGATVELTGPWPPFSFATLGES
ncbi:GvpL/GvpF family gas vesicle protein [Pseudonocardia sp. RS11V-5]|uniref:GvpL/GvpF family gas vesicle protein n=1 Tax=Pseudonocardia terrae TaxID=2905831 RepID=UPI001E6172A2|nr:GvpL/GvpF family gas vesicle protein [Pseudonocardia terrae]MCE3553100.1 GvpL/GvpF family gas vesicle protein [Pseudonocardia terrae]